VPGWTSGEAVGAGGAVGALVGGQLADRWGRRATLLTAQLSTAATLLLVGVSSHPGMILGSCLLLGTVQSMARPAYAAMMIDVVPESARLRAFTLQHWANNLAFSLAALLGGLLAALHYLIIFVVNAGATLLAAAVIFGKTVETRPAAPTRGTRGTPTSRHSPWRDPVFLTLSGTTFLIMLVFFQHASSLPISLAADGFPAAARGRYQGVTSLMMAAAAFLAPTIGGLVISRFGDQALWVGCFGLGLLVAALRLAAGPSRQRRITRLAAADPADRRPEPAPPATPAPTAPAADSGQKSTG